MEALICENFCSFRVRGKTGLEDEEENFAGACQSTWDKDECLVTREGDHLITPFECYLCIFVKLKNRDPIAQSEEDNKMASCIRIMNLDAF